MNWIWKDFKLILSGLSVIRIFSGENLVEVALKIKEQAGERQELNLTYDSLSFLEFIESLEKINNKVEKKDFGSKSLKYDFCDEQKVELIFYFTKNEWKQFYNFLENCSKEITRQNLQYEKLAKERE